MRCAGCGRVFWEGTHHTRMLRILEQAKQAAKKLGGGATD
jgi:uncharacterized protein with PIN domain